MSNEIKSYRRRSYFGPIMLIAIGLVFLAYNLGFIPGEGWESILKLWPVLLIIAGLNDLIRREGIAWPILLIGAGTFLLLNNLGPQSWISWTQIFQLWPVLLIAGGIDLMFKGQSGWLTILGILLSVVLIGGAIWFASVDFNVSSEYQDVYQTFGSEVDLSDIDLSLGLGELILTSESDQGVLITGSITPENNLEQITESKTQVSYRLENNTPSMYPFTARWELGLTDAIPLTLSVNNGVGEVFLALERLDLDSLDANQGVGRLVIRLPEESSQDILIKQAIGTIHIQIPADVKVAVDAQNGLSKVDFPADFKLINGLYVSPGTNRINADLSITVEQAIGYISFSYAR